MIRKLLQLAGCAGLVFALCACSAPEPEEETLEDETVVTEEEAQDVEDLPGSVTDGQKYQVTMKVKDYGEVQLEIDEGIAPETVKNFLKLVDEGFYDGLTFHRAVKGFVLQGGDPNGDGTGSADENIKGEFLSNGFNNTLRHSKGVVSMARAQDPDSGSCQFFIMLEDNFSLDGDYAAFGKVTSGMDVVEKMAADALPYVENPMSGTIEKDKQPVIESMKAEKID